MHAVRNGQASAADALSGAERFPLYRRRAGLFGKNHAAAAQSGAAQALRRAVNKTRPPRGGGFLI